jgi:hypothetical protein
LAHHKNKNIYKKKSSFGRSQNKYIVVSSFGVLANRGFKSKTWDHNAKQEMSSMKLATSSVVVFPKRKTKQPCCCFL